METCQFCILHQHCFTCWWGSDNPKLNKHWHHFVNTSDGRDRDKSGRESPGRVSPSHSCRYISFMALSSSIRVLFWFSSTATRFSRHRTYSFFLRRHSLAASLFFRRRSSLLWMDSVVGCLELRALNPMMPIPAWAEELVLGFRRWQADRSVGVPVSVSSPVTAIL